MSQSAKTNTANSQVESVDKAKSTLIEKSSLDTFEEDHPSQSDDPSNETSKNGSSDQRGQHHEPKVNFRDIGKPIMRVVTPIVITLIVVSILVNMACVK